MNDIFETVESLENALNLLGNITVRDIKTHDAKVNFIKAENALLNLRLKFLIEIAKFEDEMGE